MCRDVNEPSRVEFLLIEFETEFLLNESSLIVKFIEQFLLFELQFVKNRVEFELFSNKSSRVR